MTRQRVDPYETLCQLQEFAEYSPETGKFICIATGKGRSVLIGEQLGHIQKTTGYRYLVIRGNRFSCHALAHLWMKDVWHVGYIDHINGDRDDNRWCNLRVVTAVQNTCNIRAECRGGTGFHKASGKWRAYINLEGKNKHLGLFLSQEEAQAAYDKAYQNRLKQLGL